MSESRSANVLGFPQWRRPDRPRISRPQVDTATRQLATLLRAGVPLVQSLHTVSRSQRGDLGRVLERVRHDVESGVALDRALGRHPHVFDGLFRSLVTAGELAGMLDGMLERIADHRERSSRLRSKVRSALVYPLAVMAVAALSISVILVWVVPTFATMFERSGAELPWPTRLVMGLSDALLAYGVGLAIGATLGGVWLLRRLQHSPPLQRRMESIALALPVLGQVLVDAAAARWCRTLALLMAAGIPLTEALDTVGRVAGQQRLSEVTQRIRRDTAMGLRLAPGMARSGCFPAIAVQMVDVGEEAGALDALLAKAAESLERSVEERVGQMTTLLEPAIMLVLGIVMGGVIIALYLPVFGLGSVVA